MFSRLTIDNATSFFFHPAYSKFRALLSSKSNYGQINIDAIFNLILRNGVEYRIPFPLRTTSVISMLSLITVSFEYVHLTEAFPAGLPYRKQPMYVQYKQFIKVHANVIGTESARQADDKGGGLELCRCTERGPPIVLYFN